MSESILRDETVIVKFLPNTRNGILDPKHPLYGGLSSNASIAVPAPIMRRKLDGLFSKEELAVLSKKLSGEDLRPTSEFWREYRKDELGMNIGVFPIFLKKEGLLLNKKDAVDYIKIRILENTPIVAPSPSEVKNKESEYRFVLVKQGELHREDIKKITWKKKAVKFHTKYEDDERILQHVLRSFNKSVGSSHKLPFLQNETWKLVEAEPQLFVKAMEDEFLDEKVLIYDLLKENLLTSSNKLFFSLENDPLRLEGDRNDLEGAARYLASGVGQDLRVELEAKLKLKLQ